MYERLLTWILKPALAIFSMVASCKLPLGSPKRNFDLLVLFIFRPRRGTPRVGDIALLRPVPQDCNLGFSGGCSVGPVGRTCRAAGSTLHVPNRLSSLHRHFAPRQRGDG